MGRHTPQMNADELATYLDKHLGDELRVLLRAASEWHAQKHMNLKVVGYEVQTYAQDSTFMRSRTLFEFLTQNTGDYYYGADTFGVETIDSPRYDAWKPVLHSFIMHAQDRSAPQQLTSFDQTEVKDLNEMPVDFSREIIRLWQVFADSLKRHGAVPLGQRADEMLVEAKEQAKPVLDNQFTRGKGIPPVPW